MAEEKRSIEISYKANLKDLVSKLKTLPNITGQEAKKMVAELDRQIKQAEKAAKKATEAQKKAAKEAALAFKRNAEAIKGVQFAADDAAEKLDHVADSAGEVDRGFAAVALALNQVNPALGEAANVAADVAAVSEGLVLTIKNLNPVLLAGAAAVGVLTLGLGSYIESTKKAKEETLALREAQKSSNQETLSTKERLDIVTAKYKKYKEDLDIATGAINENTASMIKAERAVKGDFSAEITNQKNYIATLKEREQLLTRILNEDKAISDEEKEIVRNLQLSNSNIKNNQDLLNNSLTSLSAISNLRLNINDEIKQGERALTGIEAVEKRSIELEKRRLEFQQETTEETKRLEIEQNNLLSTTENINSENEKRLNNEKLLIEQNQALVNSKERLFNLTHDGLAKELKLINDTTNKNLDKAKIEFQLHNDKNLYVQNLHAIQINNFNELTSLEDKYTQKRIDNNKLIAKSFIDVFDDATKATSQYLNNTEQMTEEKAQALFKLQQLSSLANIAMATAEGLQKAAAMGLPLGPIMAVGVGAAAAANAAAVLSEKPPTLHMGGIAPDEKTTILSGEAVLDRTTTRRLGEEGIRSLQNNTDRDNVIILQPFKHIDRFNRSARKRRGLKLGSGGY